MRIFVLAINYWPEQTGIGALLTRRCEYLAAAGHDVTVCTGMPYYPEWRIQQEYAGKKFLREEHNGVKILRSWIWVPKDVTSKKRIFFESSFLATSLLQALKASCPDLLLVVSPPLGLGLSAVMLSRWWKIPYVFDVMDLQPDAAVDLGMLPKPVVPLLYKLEAMAYSKAALIATVTEGMRQRILSKGVAEEKVFVAPPPADHNLFDVGNLVVGSEFRSKHRLDGKFIVAHSGNMGVKQGLDVVLNVAVRLRDQQEFVFLLAGDGAMKPQLEERKAAMNLQNVRFLPVQEHAEFLGMLAAIDVGLIVQQSSVSDIVFPSKTVTLLSAARPIGASVNVDSEIGRVIHRSKGGVVTQPGDAEALAATLQDLFKNPAKRCEMGERGREYALKHWEKSRILSNFESALLRTVWTPSEEEISGTPVSA